MTKALEYIGDFFQWFIDLFKTLGQIITSVVSILGTCVDYLKMYFPSFPVGCMPLLLFLLLFVSFIKF